MQPIFPGESSVDQLVEIIKVCSHILQTRRLASCCIPALSCYFCVGFGNTNERGNQMHEQTLHRVQISSNQSPPVAQGLSSLTRMPFPYHPNFPCKTTIYEAIFCRYFTGECLLRQWIWCPGSSNTPRLYVSQL